MSYLPHLAAASASLAMIAAPCLPAHAMPARPAASSHHGHPPKVPRHDDSPMNGCHACTLGCRQKDETEDG